MISFLPTVSICRLRSSGRCASKTTGAKVKTNNAANLLINSHCDERPEVLSQLNEKTHGNIFVTRKKRSFYKPYHRIRQLLRPESTHMIARDVDKLRVGYHFLQGGFRTVVFVLCPPYYQDRPLNFCKLLRTG